MKRLIALAAVVALTIAASAQWSNPAKDIPAYNAAAPSKPLPPVMHDGQLSGVYFAHPYQVAAYQMAQKIQPVLHQMPCYCRCDLSMGHNSLHSCFEGVHGAECSTCMKEAVFAYRETKAGKTPAQIRAAIEKGLFLNVDLENARL